MNNAKLGPKALSLSLLVALVLCAVAAGAAHASEWIVNNVGLGHGTKTITGSGGAGKLLSIGLSIECSSSTLSGLIQELDRGLITVRFLGCKFLEGIPATLSAVCSINAADGKPGSGTIEATAKFLAFLHGGEVYLLIEPDNMNGTLNERIFTTFNIVDFVEGSEECVLSGPRALKGTQIMLVVGGTTQQLSHELQIVNNAALFPSDFLHIGANPATLDEASISVHLISDENWSFP